MSFVTTQPEFLSTAAGDLQGIGAAVQAERAAMAGPTTTVLPPAADVVSALTAAQFNAHAAMFQEVAAQAAAIHQMFVETMRGGAGSYAVAEAANVLAAS